MMNILNIKYYAGSLKNTTFSRGGGGGGAWHKRGGGFFKGGVDAMHTIHTIYHQHY